MKALRQKTAMKKRKIFYISSYNNDQKKDLQDNIINILDQYEKHIPHITYIVIFILIIVFNT